MSHAVKACYIAAVTSDAKPASPEPINFLI
jgi:hypothetical protein